MRLKEGLLKVQDTVRDHAVEVVVGVAIGIGVGILILEKREEHITDVRRVEYNEDHTLHRLITWRGNAYTWIPDKGEEEA